MKSIFAALLLILASSVKGTTLVMTGLLHNSPDQNNPDVPGVVTSQAGSFFISLNGNTLNYSISTGPLGSSFDPTQAGLMLGLPSGNLALPLQNHGENGFSGCGLYFAAYEPLSHVVDSHGPFFILGIYMPPGDCRSFWQFSILTGSVELTPAQAALFSNPDFSIGSATLGLYGRTDPNVIPEPQSFTLAAIAGLVLLKQRGPRSAVSSFILHSSSFLP